MNSEIITNVARATLAGTISFPEVVGELLAAGVEYYHVDYLGMRKSFYSAQGAMVVTPISERISRIATSHAGQWKAAHTVTTPSCVGNELLTLAAMGTNTRNGFREPTRPRTGNNSSGTELREFCLHY